MERQTFPLTEGRASALLVMDIQAPIVAGLPHAEDTLSTVRLAVDAARAHGIPVVFVVVGFRPGQPEFNPRNKGLGALRQAGVADALVDPVPILPVAETDPVVVRRRVSAFSGSDLEILLRSPRIDHVVLTGVSTSGVVLSTLRDAVDKDFVITVLSDGCADRDDEVHRVLMEKVFPRHANVVRVDEWIRTLSEPAV